MAFPVVYRGIIKAARRVFRLGSFSLAVTLGALESAAVFLACLWVCDINATIWLTLTYSASLVIAFTLLSGVGGPLDSRRAAWLVTLTQAPLAIAPLALAPLGARGIYSGLLAGLHASIYLRALSVLSMTMEVGRVLPSFLAPLLVAWWPVKSGEMGFPLFVLPLLTAALTLWLTLETEDRISRRLVGENALQTVRAIARLLLVGDPDPLEGILAARAKPGRVGILGVRLGDVAVVAPDFHPGPLGDAGSSNGPYRVLSSLEEAGLRAVFLRRVSTHGRNLPSRWWVDKVAERALEILSSAPQVEVGPPMVVRSETESIEVSAQRFGDYVLLTISGWPRDAEDFPETVELRLKERVSASGGGPIPLVVDRHDSLGAGEPWSVEPFSAEEEVILDIAWKAYRGAVGSPASKQVLVGFGSALDLRDELSSVGPGGVRVVTLREAGGSWAVAYVSVDGNNMVPELRATICARLRSAGYEPIVATTDTHYTLSPETPINPVGWEGEEEAVLRLVEAALAEAESSEAPAPVSAGYGELEVMLVGRETVDSIALAAVTADHAAPLVAMGAAVPMLPTALVGLLL
ncbi:MAG TPA: DUF2070 family protein [Candidatus Korarchaeota archaeon]|nr:DUF2070 family protein [Candidatus Korarchaeota archaeon]